MMNPETWHGRTNVRHAVTSGQGLLPPAMQWSSH
jgi:hypothetical protein